MSLSALFRAPLQFILESVETIAFEGTIFDKNFLDAPTFSRLLYRDYSPADVFDARRQGVSIKSGRKTAVNLSRKTDCSSRTNGCNLIFLNG